MNIDIITTTYDQFLSNFKIYNSPKEARKKGFEAHHIIPKAIQEDNIDDRCIRLTPFEHILAHYLLAKQYGGDLIRIFSLMVQFNEHKLIDIEKVTLQELMDWGELREEGRKKIAKNHKGKSPYNKGKKYSDDYKHKLSEAHKNKVWWNNGTISTQAIECPGENWVRGRIPYVTDEMREHFRDAHLGKKRGHHTKQTKQKISESNKKPRNTHWWTNGIDNICSEICPDGYYSGRTISNEQRILLSESHKGKKDSEKTRNKKSESIKNFYKTHKIHSCQKAIDIETGKIYNSIKEGLEDLGFSKSTWQKNHLNKNSKTYRLQKYNN